jgi:hypothetical protein
MWVLVALIWIIWAGSSAVKGGLIVTAKVECSNPQKGKFFFAPN